ncbi:MAG: YlbG family protein [Turicibacter sp.]|nr:YlbG family protein [Turicibacter sp.]
MDQRRIQVIVYTRKVSVQQKLSQLGHVIYISKKMNYVCLYINENQKDHIIAKIKNLHGIQKIELGPVALEALK